MARGSCSVCHTTYPGGERFCPVDGGAIVDDDQTDPLIGKTIDGRYLVRRLIGRGGMGAVYEADHVGLDKRVAIKFMIEVDRDALARFRREARAASRITDDHVVQIFDVGTADGREFIAMEYLDGRDLRTVMQDGPLPPARATAIATQMLRGLHAIHEAGIVHRDIKPGNILLVGDTDFVKIMDFGISTMDSGRGESVTRTGQVVGTPQFMAPEQLAGEPIDRRADLYAVGITLYAMLTGDVPFAGTSVAQIASQQLGPVPSIDAKRFGISGALAAAVTRALAPSPSQRFATALDFADALGGVGDPAASMPTVNDRPRSRVPATGIVRRTSWWRWVVVAVVLGFAATLAVVFAWPKQHVAQVAPAADAAVIAVKDDPLAAARAAERDGKLELAVARYIELDAAHPEPEYVFKIGELYERMDRASDAVLYFKRYLERAPAATDHDAVVARIARLTPPLVDAGVANATRPPPVRMAPPKLECACVSDSPYYRGSWLVAKVFPPLCRCEEDRYALCAVPWENCPEPCTSHDMTLNGIRYRCPKDGYNHYLVVVKPGSACRGYSYEELPHTFTESFPQHEREGAYACNYTYAVPDEPNATRDQRFMFAGKTGQACKGYVPISGRLLDGQLDCKPANLTH